MSLSSINEYVNEMITSNRDQDHQHILTYFDLMSEAAKNMLGRLEAAQRLLGLENLDTKLLNPEEKKVLREAVDYILCHSSDLEKDLHILHTSGVLDLENMSKNSRYHVLYNLEPIFKRASQLYFDNYGWWQAFKNRNKPAEHFVLKFEAAAKFKPENVLSDGLETAR